MLCSYGGVLEVKWETIALYYKHLLSILICFMYKSYLNRNRNARMHLALTSVPGGPVAEALPKG